MLSLTIEITKACASRGILGPGSFHGQHVTVLNRRATTRSHRRLPGKLLTATRTSTIARPWTRRCLHWVESLPAKPCAVRLAARSCSRTGAPNMMMLLSASMTSAGCGLNLGCRTIQNDGNSRDYPSRLGRAKDRLCLPTDDVSRENPALSRMAGPSPSSQFL